MRILSLLFLILAFPAVALAQSHAFRNSPGYVLPAAADGGLGMAIMAAEIDADGTLLHASGVRSVGHSTGNGEYTVVLDRSNSLGLCFAVATPWSAADIASTQMGLNGANVVYVYIQNPPGTGHEGRFTVVVYCAN